ncbi:MAG: hypothetical protein AB1400_09140 [Pseudomonadota bacterium]
MKLKSFTRFALLALMLGSLSGCIYVPYYDGYGHYGRGHHHEHDD